MTPLDDTHLLFREEAISASTLAANARLAAQLASLQVPEDIGEMRAAYAGGRLTLPYSPRSAEAETLTIDGPAGPIGLRVLRTGTVDGIFLHFHGGGWRAGTNDMWDRVLDQLARTARMAVVSVDYRLAPEHVFPAAVDDCVAAARWLLAEAQTQFGTSRLAIGGDSAGAHLAAATLLRLRDAGEVKAFRAASLMYGCYDLSLTPSVRRARNTPIISRRQIESLVAGFRGATAPDDPALSPLYADLAGLPPALISVGTLDPLLDDSLFLHVRWQAAGNEAVLAPYPGGVHAFNYLGGELADAANARAAQFLRSVMQR